MEEYNWTPTDYDNLKKANTLPELLAVALTVLDRMSQPVALVSGPIATGGKGSVEENVRAFADTIMAVRVSGKTVFNQLPFEEKLTALAKQSKMAYFTPILDEFILPILKSGKIAEIIFMKDWQSSTGSRWEYVTAGELGIERTLL